MKPGLAQLAVLSVDEMYAADKAAIDAGIAGETLMENAGTACADAIASRWRPCRVAILCGPGNNGGDGFVVARHLAKKGFRVRVALLGSREKLKGDAALMAARWEGPVEALNESAVDDAELAVDALFGAGLSRPVEGRPAEVLARASAMGIPIAAIDTPSGLDGDSGEVRGNAARASLTVTFFRAKPGHLLYPGRALCGELDIADIGTPVGVLDTVGVTTFTNAPPLWGAAYPWPDAQGHKYHRGHAVVVSGGVAATGAARLGARGALRIGAGLVTIASPSDAIIVNAARWPAIMTRPMDDASDLEGLLSDPRKNAVLLGPGNGVGTATRDNVSVALTGKRAVVLDADALTSFSENPDDLLSRLHGRTVLTPHDGEFARIFPDLDHGGRLLRARAAAERTGAVVIFKGPDTVIAAPDGRAAINTNAPPELATAGSGDVLGGFVLGLMAQGMAPFEASCAAVWCHSAVASSFGPGLISEDLPENLPGILRDLRVQLGARGPL